MLTRSLARGHAKRARTFPCMELRMWGEKPGVGEKTKHRNLWGWSGARTSIHTVRTEG